MGIFCRIKRYFEDLWAKICECKWRALASVAVAVIGVAVGVALFKAFSYSWWYFNRCAFAESLFDGGFSLFFFFLVGSLVYFLCIVVCNLIPQTRFLSWLLLFIAGFYCGANTAAAIECWSIWGVFFAILVALPEIVAYTLASFLALCEYPACRRFRESWHDFQPCLLILTVGFVVKIVTFFVILKIITAVI